MDKDYLLQVAKYIIEGHTVAEAAQHFSKSKSSIQKYLQSFRTPGNPLFDEELAQKIAYAQQQITKQGNIKGGQNGQRGSTLTLDARKKLAEMYMKGHTIESLSQVTGIPESTLHDAIRGIEEEDIQTALDGYIYGERRNKR